MKYDDWQLRHQREQQYIHDIGEILRRYFKEYDFKTGRARMLSGAEWLDQYAWQAAQRMVTGLYVDNAKTWRQAARKSMRGREIYYLLERELRGPVGMRVRELVKENAKLISSLPLEIAQRTTRMVALREQKGERATSAERYIGRIARWKAHLIARTETSKATTALTQARSEALGAGWYVWRTSQDQRVRRSHKLMEGVLINWGAPASPEKLAHEKHAPTAYQAGNIYNCRCYPEPLITWDQVAWPHRIFYHGSIRSFTLAQFKQISTNQLPQVA